MQKFVVISSAVSVPVISDFAVPFDVSSFCSFFGVLRFGTVVLQPTPLYRFLGKIRKKTSLLARKCLLGVPIFDIIPLNFRKTAILWTDFECK